VFLSTLFQAAHWCGFQPQGGEPAAESDGGSAGNSACLICLMAPSTSAIVLLVAFAVLFRSAGWVGGLQMCSAPILNFFRLYIRPPPFLA